MYSFHIHSTFCDGENTPEEIVAYALEKGFLSIGFSGHGYTGFDLEYCMKDTDGYIAEIRRLQRTCKGRIQIYLGLEEDAFSPADRSRFDYIIGSSHYFYANGQYFPIDSDPDSFKKCQELFHCDAAAMAECYYRSFCSYIARRKPDIIGHFDLITKFDEQGDSFLLRDAGYRRIAERYTEIAADAGCIFEVNTGAIARGLCTTPYPREHLLRILQKRDARIILSSDSHSMETLDFGFEETKRYLRDLGFRFAYALLDGRFQKYAI